MDFNYVYSYAHQLWRVDKARLTADHNHIISSDATFLMLNKFRYAILNLDDPDPVEQVVSTLMQNLFDQTQPQNSSDLPFYIEPAPLDLQSRLRLEVRGYAEALLAEPNSQNRRTIQIGVIMEVRREGERVGRSRLEKVEFERWLMEEECAICFNKYKEEEEIMRMPCQHVFHGNCIFKWLRRNKSCPMCRFKLSS